MQLSFSISVLLCSLPLSHYLQMRVNEKKKINRGDGILI